MEVPPKNIVRGKVGDCYDTSMVNVMESFLQGGSLKYVEGIARHPETDEWILHAWLFDTDKGVGYDPTWKVIFMGEERPVPTEYIGIDIPIEVFSRFVGETQYKCLLENSWRAPHLVEPYLPKGLPITKK